MINLKLIFKKNVNKVLVIYEFFCVPLFFFVALLSRYFPRKWDIGIGPEPLINNVYHKKALTINNFKAQTFVTSLYFITDEFDKKFVYSKEWLSFVAHRLAFVAFWHALFNYRCLYIYFNGGPLYPTSLLWRFEPWFFKIAGIKTVVMPYGSDVQLMELIPNLAFRSAVIKDYPKHKLRHEKIRMRLNLWSLEASHVISGCDWVDTMFHWDTLMLGHFSIDIKKIQNLYLPEIEPNKMFQILHAPNHRNIKGTVFVQKAVAELQAEGLPVELILLERVSNDELIRTLKRVDLVIDQLIIGWYAMFAIEAMASGKPVLCYLREDLMQLYQSAGLIAENEIPIIQADISSVKEKIRYCYHNKDLLTSIGNKGKTFVEKHHSLESIGNKFKEINHSIGIYTN